jgi:hypothetical protein
MVEDALQSPKGVLAPTATDEGQAPARAAAWWDPRFWPCPDLTSGARLFAVALATWATVCVIQARKYTLHRPLGDTDDAMRLVIVRDLLAGRGWYDQVIARIQPPAGVWLHWSRLLDGGLAGAMALLRPFVGPAGAEWLVRGCWPLAWILPAVGASLAVARGLVREGPGARAAVLLTIPLLLIDPQLYRQFTPGRIDHHNVQIAMTVVAMACLLARENRVRWAAAGGVAAGLGLAIGLEALAFQALIGAGYALDLARDRNAARPAAAYGLALAVSAAVFAATQTPPWRWSMTFCDALSLNLVAALAVAGLGLSLTALVAARASARTRLVLLAVTGAAAAATYLALAPRCIHGPFADMDPAVRPFWFNHIQEVQPLPRMLNLARLPAIVAIVMMAASLGAIGLLLWRERKSPSTGVVVMAASLVVAAVTAYLTWRMQDYVFWLGIPTLGAAYGVAAGRWLRGRLLPSLVLAALLTPDLVGQAIGAGLNAIGPPHRNPTSPGPRCFDPRGFTALARLPLGVVLGSPDMGPYVLALTSHSVVTAPYHRLSESILAAHQAFNAPPALAEARVRALRADYVIDCPPYPMFLDGGSLGHELRKGRPPAWLTRLSAPGATLVIYGVKPANAR